MTLVWSGQTALGESSNTWATVGSLNDQRKLNFSQHSKTHIVSKLPQDSHVHASSSMHTLTMVYTYAIRVLHWSQLTPTYFLCLGYHALAFLFFRWSLCRFYLPPNVSINLICWFHRRSRQYVFIWYRTVWSFNCVQTNDWCLIWIVCDT